MPEQEQEVKDLARRTGNIRLLFPDIPQQTANTVDKLLVERVEKLIDDAISEFPEEIGVQKEVMQALAVMYLKSNLDAMFESVYGKPSK